MESLSTDCDTFRTVPRRERRKGEGLKDKTADLLARLKAFEAAHPSKPGPCCAVCKFPPAVQSFLIKGRAQGSTFQAIASVLSEGGPRIAAGTVSRHLRDHAKGQ